MKHSPVANRRLGLIDRCKAPQGRHRENGLFLDDALGANGRNGL